MRQNRLKSPVLWGAMAGIILLALKTLGIEPDSNTSSELLNKIFELACAAAAIFGIINNPTSKNGF